VAVAIAQNITTVDLLLLFEPISKIKADQIEFSLSADEVIPKIKITFAHLHLVYIVCPNKYN